MSDPSDHLSDDTSDTSDTRSDSSSDRNGGSPATLDEMPHVLDDSQPLAVGARYSSWKTAKAAVIQHSHLQHHATPKAYKGNNKKFKIWTCLSEDCAFRAYFVHDVHADNIRLSRLTSQHTCDVDSVPARYGVNQRAYIDSEVSFAHS